MVGMQLSNVNGFAADPATVHALLTNELFLSEVCLATGAVAHRVAASPTTTAVERTLPSPSAVRRFTGETLTISEASQWGPPAADGSRTGTIRADVLGMPVTLTGELRLQPGGVGTELRYEGTLTVSIPLLGSHLEREAAPALLDALAVQEQVAARWLQPS